MTARTCAADHTPPRGAEIPRPFNSFAIKRSEFAPAVRISSITGAKSAAEEALDELETKVGTEGRRKFERFLASVRQDKDRDVIDVAPK
jgi:hypothetical protein